MYRTAPCRLELLAEQERTRLAGEAVTPAGMIAVDAVSAWPLKSASTPLARQWRGVCRVFAGRRRSDVR